LYLDLGRSQVSYRVQPVVVFSILDHYKRRNVGQRRVVGTLLGEKKGNVVFIKNCFPVPHQEDDDQVLVDMEYHVQMIALHHKVNPREQVVGWYSTGDKITYVSSLIHDVYKAQVEWPVHVTVDTNLSNLRMSVKAYTATNITIADKPCVAKFESAPLELWAPEAEKIGVDALISGQPDDKRLDAPATILSDFDNFEHSMMKLLDALDIVTNYVNEVVEGKRSGDEEIGRMISSALGTIPNVDATTLDKLFNSNIQDLLCILYLANLTKSQLALADKINAILL